MTYYKWIVGFWISASCMAQPVVAQIVSLTDMPSEEQRLSESRRLDKKREDMDASYQSDMKACYQRFDVVSCQLKARDKRLAVLAELRKEEQVFNAQERQIKAAEAAQRTLDKTSETQLQEAANQRQEAVQSSKDRQERSLQKQQEHANQGTNRSSFDMKQREAVQHRIDAEKRRQERTNKPADPLPLPRDAH